MLRIAPLLSTFGPASLYWFVSFASGSFYTTISHIHQILGHFILYRYGMGGNLFRRTFLQKVEIFFLIVEKEQ